MLDKLKVGVSIRIFLLVVGATIWLGIWHTGFNMASWILYIPAVFLTIAAISGICPGIFFSKLISGELKLKKPA